MATMVTCVYAEGGFPNSIPINADSRWQSREQQVKASLLYFTPQYSTF
jgi:hypothetical protein